jgi:hypothetical protein
MSIHYLAIDSDPHYPLPEGQFGGFLRDRSGNRIVLSNTTAETFRVGIFNAGKWNADPAWTEVWVEIKPMITSSSGNSVSPTSTTAASIAVQGGVVDTATTRLLYDAGTAGHTDVVYTDTLMAGITSPGTYWAIVTLNATGAQGTAAAGKITITA